MRPTFDQALRLRGVSVREDTAAAARFLEAQDLRYGKDFIARDAIDVAGQVILELEADGIDAEAAVISRLRKPVARTRKAKQVP